MLFSLVQKTIFICLKIWLPNREEYLFSQVPKSKELPTCHFILTLQMKDSEGSFCLCGKGNKESTKQTNISSCRERSYALNECLRRRRYLNYFKMNRFNSGWQATLRRMKKFCASFQFSGNAGDSLGYHRGSAFSTKDRDNDNSRANCAAYYKGPGWWFNSCVSAILNGIYYHGKPSNSWTGINWGKWKGHSYSAKRAEMKIRPVNF